MAIDTVLNPVGMARKLSVPQLQQAIQNGTIPPYVGIPVLQEKIAGEQRLRGAAAMQGQPKQPPIAQQVMAEASGLDKLQSNLPTEYAGGGIVAFASGGSLAKMLLADDEEADDDYIDSVTDAMAKMDAMRERISELGAQEARGSVDAGSEGMAAPYVAAKKTSEGVTVKEGNQPARTVEREKQTVVEPKGIDELLAMIQQKESGGRRYGKDGRLLTSPKGAMGEMQVMPGTARDPGFGLRPAREGDPEDLARLGKEYYTKMLERYGDPKIAAIAYNWGPGNTDKWLSAGADPSKLPGETRQYAQGFAEGGITGIKRFQLGGLSAMDLMNSPLEDVKRMARMGEPGAAEELDRRLKNRGIDTSRMAKPYGPAPAPGIPAPAAPAVPAAAAPAAAAPAAAAESGIGALGRLAVPAGIGVVGYEVGKNVLEKKQAQELEKYGKEPEPTDEELERASRPAFYPSMSRKQQAERGEKPLAPLTYTPAGVETYGPRPGYTPPSAASKKPPIVGPGSSSWGMDLGKDEVAPGISGPGESGWGMDLGQDAIVPEPKQKAEAAKEETPKESETMSKLRERITKGYEKLDKQEAIDNYLAILSAGLGMMGGSSPFASVNIGKGALQGVQSYLQSGASRAAQEKALMSAELGTERYGQLGQLQREQMLMRKQIADAERERKEEATRLAMEGKGAALAERQRQSDEKFLNQMESEANRIVESSGKLAALENIGKKADEIAQAKKKMIDDLLFGNKRYMSIYNRLYPGVIESFGGPKKEGNTIAWGQL